nr:hypothetical protein [Halomonas halmophila]
MATAKYQYALPLYRQQQTLGRHGAQYPGALDELGRATHHAVDQGVLPAPAASAADPHG